jgi:Fe/S biogenesis protein NfuA
VVLLEFTDDARERLHTLMDFLERPALRIASAAAEGSPLAAELEFTLVERDDAERGELLVDAGGIKLLVAGALLPLVQGRRVEFAEGGFRFHRPVPSAGGGNGAGNGRGAGGSGSAGRLAERVQRVIDEKINPGVASHGGSIELIDVQDSVALVRMSGGCQGCGMAAVTLRQGVDRMIREWVPEILEVRDVTDHASGENPYY